MENMQDLGFLGWNPYFESQLKDTELKDFTIARVSIEYKNQFRLLNSDAEFQGEPSGSLLYSADANSALPKVGDWVLITPYDENKAIIQRVLPRKTQLSRKAA